MTLSRVAVIGAGISGAACAVALRQAGLTVEIFDRGRAPGGRLASPELHGRRVDLGAAYFTVGDDRFAAVVDGWQARKVARPWTDTLDVFDANGRHASTGRMRWSTPGGMRSLARDLLPVEVAASQEITALGELDHDAVVLAMPDPQARRLLGDTLDWVDYEPVIAVAMGWPVTSWNLDAAAFVNDDPDVTLIADDGARRADGAPVLVVHSSADRARKHLDDPDAAIDPLVAATRRLLDIGEAPEWTRTHRWTFAKPAGTHGDAPFALTDHAGRPAGVCGDSWCPQGAPRVEAAWLSGTRLGESLAHRLS